MSKKYDFAGWATRANVPCSDGRMIMRDAFKDQDGQEVPLVWNHNHEIPQTVLGKALLHSQDGDMYAYCSFNDTESGKDAKLIVEHGDVKSLSILANRLQERSGHVIHGIIREVSLVLAGANPSARIETVLAHSDGTMDAVIYNEETITLVVNEDGLQHSDENNDENKTDSPAADDNSQQDDQQKEDKPGDDSLAHSEDEKKEDKPASDDKKDDEEGESVGEVLKTLTEKQKTAVAIVIDAITGEEKKGENTDDTNKDNKEEDTVKHNVFDQDSTQDSKNVLCHADGVKIIEMAKANGGNSLKSAMQVYAEDNQKTLAHADGDNDLGFANIGQLFPEYSDTDPGAPKKIGPDTSWVGKVLAKTKKSPKSRLRVRRADVRDIEDRRARGYKKGAQKHFMGNLKLLGRTVDPTTVYNLDHLDRDDIIDITDFDIVQYMYQDQDGNLKGELARQIMIGDGRNGDVTEEEASKAIDATKIIPIWGDDELFAIHKVVDFEAMKEELQGTDTGRHFGENYIYSEAILQNLLYARENYKGSGSPDFFCTPHLVNVMLLARDFNGRRIYDNRNDLVAAMNIGELITVEQFANKTRKVVVDGVEQTRRLLGILVNLNDYTVGATKGGEITHFTDFDIHFNQHESLLETRCSGMLTVPFSAIILEEVVNPQ